MTEPSAESFTISEIPIIDPLSILKAVQLIKQDFRSIAASDKLCPNKNQKEAGHEKQAAANSTFHTKRVGKDGTVPKKAGDSGHGRNDKTNHSKPKRGGL